MQAGKPDDCMGEAASVAAREQPPAPRARVRVPPTVDLRDARWPRELAGAYVVGHGAPIGDAMREARDAGCEEGAGGEAKPPAAPRSSPRGDERPWRCAV